MGTPKRPWTEEDGRRRDKILALAKAKGITQKSLGEAAGIVGDAGAVMMSRWSRGKAHLTDEQIGAMSHLVNSSPGSMRLGSGPSSEGEAPLTAEAVKAALTELDALVDVPAGDEEEQLRTLARQNTRAAVGTLLRMMVGARSDTVKLRAAEVLLERGWGKAVQAVLDVTPKAPATDAELIAIFAKLADTLGAADNYPELSAKPAFAQVPQLFLNDALQPLKPTLDNGVKVFNLTIDEINQHIDELQPPVAALGYNGQWPGPTIRVTEGDRVRAVFTNNLK